MVRQSDGTEFVFLVEEGILAYDIPRQKKDGSWGKTIALFYNGIMLLALVYLGEHYVIDALAGIIIAIVAWLLSGKILSGWFSLKMKKQMHKH